MLARLREVAVPVLLAAVVCADAAGAAEVRRVSSPLELNEVLRGPFRGTVVVPRDVRWKMADPCGARDEFRRCVEVAFRDIPMRAGVHLMGERGPAGSRPLLYTDYKDYYASHQLFRIEENDVRVSGLHLRGPKTDRKKETAISRAIAVIENPETEQGRRITIAGNEFDQWSGAGVLLTSPYNAKTPSDYDVLCQTEQEPTRRCRHLEPADAELVRVEGNYFHHNAMDTKGYGVTVSGGAYGAIEGNVFDFNRHAVAASGSAYQGYLARFNFVLSGGFTEDGYYNQHFDVHGTGGGGYGGPAGERYEIAHNTIRGDQKYRGGLKTRPAFLLRGKPRQGAFFHDNVLAHHGIDPAVSLKDEAGDTGYGEVESEFNFDAGANRYGSDYSTELAVGDFDGDRVADAFVATGTAWFFSRRGITPWEYLRPSNKRTGELGFADIDNDRVTDVLYRDAAGNLGYLDGGRGQLLPLTTTPVPIKDLRFGDFDGDGLTDIFSTRAGAWHVWLGKMRTWRHVNDTIRPISELLFGEFDAVRGTDVATVTGGAWKYSSGATSGWRRLNKELASSFAGAVAADFDGNGKTDIAFSRGQTWRFSRDGRSAMATLRPGRTTQHYAPLKHLLVGRFTSSTRAMAVGFEPKLTLRGYRPGERLRIWRGLGSGGDFSPLSTQNMR